MSPNPLAGRLKNVVYKLLSSCAFFFGTAGASSLGSMMRALPSFISKVLFQ